MSVLLVCVTNCFWLLIDYNTVFFPDCRLREKEEREQAESAREAELAWRRAELLQDKEGYWARKTEEEERSQQLRELMQAELEQQVRGGASRGGLQQSGGNGGQWLLCSILS